MSDLRVSTVDAYVSVCRKWALVQVSPSRMRPQSSMHSPTNIHVPLAYLTTLCKSCKLNGLKKKTVSFAELEFLYRQYNFLNPSPTQPRAQVPLTLNSGPVFQKTLMHFFPPPKDSPGLDETTLNFKFEAFLDAVSHWRRSPVADRIQGT